MRFLGTLICLLGIVALIIGLATGYATYLGGSQVFGKVEQGRDIVDGRIKDVKSVFSEVNGLLGDSRDVVNDYYAGNIRDIADDRIETIFGSTKKLLDRTETIRTDIVDSLDQVEKIRVDIELELVNLLPQGLITAGCIFGSGWLFGFGMMFRAMGRRRR